MTFPDFDDFLNVAAEMRALQQERQIEEADQFIHRFFEGVKTSAAVSNTAWEDDIVETILGGIPVPILHGPAAVNKGSDIQLSDGDVLIKANGRLRISRRNGVESWQIIER